MILNLPQYSFRTRVQSGKKQIFDEFRRKWVALTPEEWVRQHFARYLTEVKHFPCSLVAIEHALRIHQNDFRADMVLFSKSGVPLAVVECKAPNVKISQEVFDQIARYNLNLRVGFLVVTNGLTHFCCQFESDELRYSFLAEIPDFDQMERMISGK